MDRTFRRKLLACLTGAALGISVGTASEVGAAPTDVPLDLVEELLDDVGEEDWRDSDLLRLAALLTDARDAEVRELAPSLVTRFVDPRLAYRVDALLAQLARDRTATVRDAAIESLVAWLERLDRARRSQVVGEWALSTEPRMRQAIALALAAGIDSSITDSAIEFLSRDGSSRVRKAVAQAAEARFHEAPDVYRSVLRHLTSDKNRQVGRTARSAAIRLAIAPVGAPAC